MPGPDRVKAAAIGYRRPMTQTDMLLEVSNLAYSYNGLAAVRDVSFHAGRGEIVALLGANGAGKSTTVKVVAGALRAKSGTIRFDGEALEGAASHVVVRRGITLVPEGRLVFAQMTVTENMQMGGFTQPAAAVARAIEHCFTLFPRLAERRTQRAGSLSGGEQQMLAIARALLTDPKVLLLDEPSEGLAPQIVEEVGVILGRLKGAGLSIILVEQNTKLALGVADEVAMLNTGRLVFSGTVGDATADPNLMTQHLGVH